MKTLITLLITLLISISSLAQQGINYKAILKDTNGNLLAGTFMTVQFTIHESSPTGTIVYQEDHINYTTDVNGMVILNIGTDTSPIIGVFADIDWSINKHFLQTSIIYSGGTINFDATEFMAVPYAKHAQTATTAANVFSGDYNDLINQPTTIPSGLEQITEESASPGIFNTGWRLIGRNFTTYGPIGDDAVDLSYPYFNAVDAGATGYYSFASGFNTKASGSYSTAMGDGTTASGNNSTAMGNETQASGYSSTALGLFTDASGFSSVAIGNYTRASGHSSMAFGNVVQAKSYMETVIGNRNVNYTPLSTDSWNDNDPLFVVGNGRVISNSPVNILHSDAFKILKNGTITAPSFDISMITDPKALLTKEYADANYEEEGNYLLAGGNVVSNNVGVGRASSSSLFEVAHPNSPPNSSSYDNAFSIHNIGTGSSWQFYTSTNLNLYKNGTFKGSWNPMTGAYVQGSDRRIKKDITALGDGTLGKVMQLNPVSYLMKDQTDSKRNMGLISQEVQKIFPTLTSYVDGQDLLALSYTELIPILIKALQEQQDIIEQQKTKDIIQDTSIAELVLRLNQLEANQSHKNE